MSHARAALPHRSRSARLGAVTLVLASALSTSSSAFARIGFGDPMEVFREREPEQWIAPHGHLRLRGALFGNLDLDRGPSPSTKEPLWPRGEGPLDHTAGADLRLRLSPSFFLGDDVRVLLEVDVLDNAALGITPRGAPFGDRTAIVAGTAFQDPYTYATGAFRLRTAMAEVMTPLGVLAAGRMPSHFGLGIAANAGDALDDDAGDRADRVAFVAPLFGHFVAVGFDWAASGAAGADPLQAPEPRRVSDASHAVSVGILRFRAPWERELYKRAGHILLDYGVGLSTQWQANDTPGFYQHLDPALAGESGRVRRDYLAFAVDAWARFEIGALRVEGEAVALHFTLDNPSPWAGVEVRQPVSGNPFGAVLQAEYALFADTLAVVVETGVASADPAFGFPTDASSLQPARAGDVYGPQLDGTRDARMDAFRFHPAYRVDLILWRTILGGVSEAAFGRLGTRARPLRDVEVELFGIYSHALFADSAPGGRAPLGFEVDAAATLFLGAFSLRTDVGVLLPFGGLGARGGVAPSVAHMALVRLGYAM